jgi:acyl-CoA synthetase (NDP forming)
MSAGETRSRRQDLSPMLKARSVGLVGISQPGRFGGLLFENLRSWGYAGALYGVNPRYESLYDRPCYPSLRDLPERPDCALLAVPNSRVEAALEEVAECGIPAAVVFGNAWSEPDEQPSLQARLAGIARESGTVLCGPNCMGFISLGHRLPVTGYPTNPAQQAGNVTLISHSGSVWDAFVQNQRGVRWDYIISSGNEAVTTVADYMQFALGESTTQVIGIFLETVRDPETFEAALEEAAEKDVPVVVMKSGRSQRGAALAQAHSGALAGEDGVYEAVFERYGVRRATSFDEMMDTLELFASGIRPATPYVSAILDSGGQRALLVDLAEAEGVEFASINDTTRDRLAEVLEPGLEPINPLDAWGTGNAAEDIYSESVLALDADPATGLTVFSVDLYPGDNVSDWYPGILAGLKDRLQKPLVWMVHLSAAASLSQMEKIRGLGAPVLMGTETGIRALRHLIEYTQFRQRHENRGAESLGEVSQPVHLPDLRARLEESSHPLDEFESKKLLAAYGIDTTRECVAESLDDALAAATQIGYPVVLKTAIGNTHKTESDGVRLNLIDASQVEDAYRDLADRLGSRVLVQEMVPAGTELILGVVDDAQFGPMLTIGTGGIFVEVFQDVVMRMLPTTPEAVRDALMGLRGAALLRGVRGRPPADVKAIVRAAMGLSALATDLGDWVAEIDVNPLIALPDRAVAVDGLVVPKTRG